MSLSALPSELKLEIAAYLDPATNFSLAITCKSFWNLCRPAVEEHARLAAKWRVIGTSEPQTVSWQALVNFVKHPATGWYVRELNLPESGWEPGTDGVDQQYFSLPEEDRDLLQRAVRKLRDVYPEEEHGGQGEVDEHPIAVLEGETANGGYDALLAILVHYLPNVKTLRYTECIDLRCLVAVIEKCVSIHARSTKAPHIPLQRLETVAISHRDSEGCCNPQWMYEFLRFPSLRTFVGNAMGCDMDFESIGYIPARDVSVSNVTEIFLERCQFDVETLGKIIAGVKALRKLYYRGGGGIVGEGFGYEPKKVIKALIDAAAHSLEHLILDHDSLMDDINENDLPQISLRPFQKLAILDCDWRMLLPETDPSSNAEDPLEQGFHTTTHDKPAFDLRSILPASLQELYLHGEADPDEWKRITEPFDHASSETPQLEKFRIERMGRGDDYQTVVQEFIGSAPGPEHTYDVLTTLLEGHGYC